MDISLLILIISLSLLQLIGVYIWSVYFIKTKKDLFLELIKSNIALNKFSKVFLTVIFILIFPLAGIVDLYVRSFICIGELYAEFYANGQSKWLKR